MQVPIWIGIKSLVFYCKMFWNCFENPLNFPKLIYFHSKCIKCKSFLMVSLSWCCRPWFRTGLFNEIHSCTLCWTWIPQMCLPKRNMLYYLHSKKSQSSHLLPFLAFHNGLIFFMKDHICIFLKQYVHLNRF